MFRTAALTTFVITLLIIGTLVFDAWDYLSKLADTDDGLGALFDIGWFPRRGIFDIATLVVGTLIVTGIAMLVAVPLGLGAAVYLSEYAKPRVRRIFKPIIEILAGIPSVVLGYFAIAFINPNLVANLFSSANKAFTLAAAGMAVGVLTIPIIASVTEDALRAVPMALREALVRTRRKAIPDDVQNRLPGRDLGDRRRAHPRHVESDRRDDGGRHRGRGNRRWALQSRSAPTGADDDRRDGSVGIRQRPGRRR